MIRPDPADAAFDAAVLEPWRGPGRVLVNAQWSEFHDHLPPLRRLIEQQRYPAAALAAQIAANHAVLWHPGIFHSPELEAAVDELGRRALPDSSKRPAPPVAPAKRRVLHVATRIGSIGGHVRMMSHWIAADKDSQSSVALTRQQGPVPPMLTAALTSSGGNRDVALLNRQPGSLIDSARRLQQLFAEADLVVLHVHNMDVVAFLALSGMQFPPPVILLNHGDHLFILGSGLVDLVVCSRRSGEQLCRERRGIEPRRIAILPLCLEPLTHAPDRNEARRQLGIGPEKIVLLTVARGVKYRNIGSTSFADTLLPILQHHPELHLVAIGPGGAVDWSAAQALLPGRITLHAERPDTAQFFAAADIYVDSFPFVSITSMFEAGLHGLPLVTRYPFGPGCDVLGSDSPGLDGLILRCRSLNVFYQTIHDLAEDPTRRQALGAATQAAIRDHNMGPHWVEALAAVYAKAIQLQHAPRLVGPLRDEPAHLQDLDLISPFVYGDMERGATSEARCAYSAEIELKAAPLGWRLRNLLGLLLLDRLQLHRGHRALRNLIPEWLSLRLRLALPKKA